MAVITCKLMHDEKLDCNGTVYQLSVSEENLSPETTMFWVYLCLYLFLNVFAGMMSGLTMGLLSLGETQLEVLEKAGNPDERKYAKRIYPLVKRHHLLLVTLLLANVGAVETMPIFMDRITSPVVAIVVSVTGVLLFGEIVPQALCTRYGLAIGYYLAPIVYVLIGALFIVAWPISKLLDFLLGQSHATFFQRAELKQLVDIHLKEDNEDNEEPLTLEESRIIKGALDLKDKVAKNAFVPLESVFMLEDSTLLDWDTMKTINERGHSRIPVFSGTRENIIGVLLVKSIITADPEDAEPITGYIKGGLHIHHEDKPLYEILHACQDGKSHLCIVKSELDVTMGIITLEDVIEEILGDEIVDETDVYTDVAKRLTVSRVQLFRSLSRPQPQGIESQDMLSMPHTGFVGADADENTPLISVP